MPLTPKWITKRKLLCAFQEPINNHRAEPAGWDPYEFDAATDTIHVTHLPSGATSQQKVQASSS